MKKSMLGAFLLMVSLLLLGFHSSAAQKRAIAEKVIKIDLQSPDLSCAG